MNLQPSSTVKSGAYATATLLGVLVLTLAYRSAETGNAPYGWFWLGLICLLAPPTLLLLSRPEPSKWTITAAGSSYLLASVLPKLLRSLDGIAYFDEKLHVARFNDVLATGNLLVVDPINPVLSGYPMTQVYMLIGSWFGVDPYATGLGVAIVMHALVLISLFTIYKQVGLDNRSAAIALGVYAVAPSFMWVYAQVSYQPFALPFLLISVSAALRLVRTDAEREPKSTFALFGLCLSATAITMATHHVTAISLGVILIEISYIRASRSTRLLIAATGAVSVVGSAIWYVVRNPYQLSYLLPGVPDFGSDASESGSAVRQAFTGSALPFYEQLAGFAAPAIACSLALLGVWVNRKTFGSTTLGRAIVAVAVIYPLTIPLTLISSTNITAHRVWPFLYLAVAPLVALGVVALSGWRPRWNLGAAQKILLAGLLLVLAVGNTANDSSQNQRFPGTYRPGSTTGSYTSDTEALAEQIVERYGPLTRYIADIDTAVDLRLAGGGWPVRGVPVWGFLFNQDVASYQYAAAMAANLDVELLIVDTRLSSTVGPARGYYFDSTEPFAYTGESSHLNLERPDEENWARYAFSTGPYRVYEMRTEEMLDGLDTALQDLGMNDSLPRWLRDVHLERLETL